jgi:hypothetical protein
LNQTISLVKFPEVSPPLTVTQTMSMSTKQSETHKEEISIIHTLNLKFPFKPNPPANQNNANSLFPLWIVRDEDFPRLFNL